jgi:hypothetical protein
MPSTSKKQHNFMAAVANNPAFAKKVGVPQSVGKDFSNADKGKTFKRGGDMAKANPFMEMIAKKKAMAAGKKSEMPSKMGKPVMPGMDTAKDGMKKMAAGGMAYAKGGGIESKGKTKGKMVTMKSGGKAC